MFSDQIDSRVYWVNNKHFVPGTGILGLHLLIVSFHTILFWYCSKCSLRIIYRLFSKMPAYMQLPKKTLNTAYIKIYIRSTCGTKLKKNNCSWIFCASMYECQIFYRVIEFLFSSHKRHLFLKFHSTHEKNYACNKKVLSQFFA